MYTWLKNIYTVCNLYRFGINIYSRFLDLRIYTNMVLIIILYNWFNHFVTIFTIIIPQVWFP